MLNVGERLQGRYEVRGIIGKGGMGTVYDVFDHRLQTSHALKEAHIADEAERLQFEREARLLAPLRHLALPRVLDHFEDGGRWFLVMELVSGDDLLRLLARHGPFDAATVLGWADEILDALEYIHTRPQPIIHRDIKPSNLKLTEAGRVALLDFGIAKQQSESLTVGSAKAVSYAYSPLEQFGAGGRTDARSDIYALGATLYHLLAGKAPPSAPERLQGVPLPMLTAMAPDCPPQVASAIERALALRPEQRFQTAREMRRALVQSALVRAAQPDAGAPYAAVGQTIVAPPPARAPAKRRGLGPLVLVPLLAVAAVAVLAVAVLAGGDSGQVTALPRTGAAATAAPAVHVSATAVVAATASASPVPTGPPAATDQPAATRPPIGLQRPHRISASAIAPPSIDADGNTISYDPANVVDGRADTTWRVAGDGVGQSLTLTFAGPVTVGEVQIIPGYAKVDPLDGTDRFFQNRRVRRLQLVFDDGSSVEAELKEVARLQQVRFAPVRTRAVRIVILATTEPGEADGGRDFTPISEIVVLGWPEES